MVQMSFVLEIAFMYLLRENLKKKEGNTVLSSFGEEKESLRKDGAAISQGTRAAADANASFVSFLHLHLDGYSAVRCSPPPYLFYSTF